MRLTLLLLAVLAALPARAQSVEAVAMTADVLRVFLDHEPGHDEENDSCWDCVQCSAGANDESDSACGSSNDDERLMTYSAICAGAGLTVVLVYALATGQGCADGGAARPSARSRTALQKETAAGGVMWVESRAEADVMVSVRRARQGVGLGPATDRLAIRVRDARTGRALPLGALGGTEAVLVGEGDLTGILASLHR